MLHLQQFQLYDILITVPASDGYSRQPVDFSLGLVFRCLDAQTVLLILTAIMTQQRLLFMSSNYVLLTLVMEVNKALINALIIP